MKTHTPKDHPHENYFYTLNEQTNCITITGYEGRSKSIIIPSEIEGQPVIEIGSFAFERNQLTNVTIPPCITRIGDATFANNQLRNVTIPNNLPFIAAGIFFNNHLTEIIIPASVTKICDFAFENNQLATLTIPDNVTEIGHHAFANNPHLKNIIIPDHTQIQENSFPSGCQIIRHSDQNDLIAELLKKKHVSTHPPGNLSL